ncbi:MAG TPA: DUF2630 family protein [Candidatus Cybelea sp.]|jgi:hypothetical protein|nr:DUF2630 family protein [Candidatus Cybelea sp.]
MNDTEINQHIEGLVDEEHRLLEHGERGGMTDHDRARLEAITVQLDQFWDLLRQRRARRDAGQDPGVANLRSEEIVEHYRQ